MKETNCFPGTDGQRGSSQEEQLETLRRVYRETLCNRGWCLLCLRLGTIISWSVDCRTLSGSWTSTHCRERRHDRWRRPDDTNSSLLSGANFPWANFAFAYISPAYVRARGWSSHTHTGRSCRDRSHRLALPTFPCVITALRFNSAAGTSDSAAFCVDAAHRARYRNLPLPLFLPKKDSFWLGFCLHAGESDRSTLRSANETLWDELTTRAKHVNGNPIMAGWVVCISIGHVTDKRNVCFTGGSDGESSAGWAAWTHWFRWLTPSFAARLEM